MAAIVQQPQTTGKMRDGRVEVILTLDTEARGDWFLNLTRLVGDMVTPPFGQDRRRIRAYLDPDSLREDLARLLAAMTDAQAEAEQTKDHERDAVARVDRELELWWEQSRR